MNKIFKFIFNVIHKLKNKKVSYFNKILFIRFDNKVGDTIIESFFLRELKKINSKLLIDIIILNPYTKLIENNPYKNKIYSVPFNKKKWLKAFSLIPKLRKEKYDLIVDIPTKPTVKRLFYSYLINSKKIMSANSDGLKIIDYNVIWDRNCHLSKIFVNALNLLGVKDVDTRYELFIGKQDQDFANKFIIENNLKNKSILVFNPKSSTSTRTLNRENIKKILVYLQKYDYSIVLLDYEKEYDEFKDLAILYTSNNIMQVAALIQQSDYVLTTDTGIVHITDVYLKPMTVLYCDVFKEGDKPRNDSYIKEWKSINSKTKILRDKYNVNKINVNAIFDILEEDLK